MPVIIIASFLSLVTVIKKTVVEAVNTKILILYTIFTCVILFISSFNPLGLYGVTNRTYAYLLLSIASFVLAFILMTKIIPDSIEVRVLPARDDALLHSKAVNVAFLITFLTVVFYKLKYNATIKRLKPGQYRIARFTELFDSTFETLFFNYIVTGMVLIATIVFAVLIVKKEYKNLLIYICGGTVLVYSLIGYGRMIYFAIMIYLVFSVLVINDVKNLLRRKVLIRLALLVLFAIILCTGLIYLRTAESYYSVTTNIKNALVMQARQLIEYFTVSMRLLDDFLKNGFARFPEHTYGRATFAGVEEILMYPIKGLGVDINTFNNIIPLETQVAKQVGQDTTANAFYTCVMNYYLDFGIIGVVLFSGLHGCLISFAAYTYIKRRDFLSLVLLNYVFYHLLFSIVMWDYQSGTYVFVLALLIISIYFSGRGGLRKEDMGTKGLNDERN